MKKDYLDLRHARHFLAVADELHFGRAAARIGIAQPPLSHSIARLERMIGHCLFYRGGGGPTRVTLTEAGFALLPAARQLVSDAAGAIEQARAAGSGEAGLLRLAFVGSLMGSALPSALRAYRRAMPDVRLTLHEMTTEPMLAALLAKDVDLGIGREIDEGGLITAARLFDEPLFVVVPRDDPLAFGAAVSLADLRDRPFILPPVSAGSGFLRRLHALCDGAGFRPRLAQEAREWPTILGLVGAGFGVALAPACALKYHRPDVCVLALSGAEAVTTVSLCWRNDTTSTVRNLFVEALNQRFAAQ